jgi:restriction system protein
MRSTIQEITYQSGKLRWERGSLDQASGKVKITQASRDGGVDAIAFDLDRSTMKGATKGILVTTPDYGPDAYEFAKGKPLTLLSGSELLY